MSQRRKKREVVTAEFVTEGGAPPAPPFDPVDLAKTPEELAADEADFQLRLRARCMAIAKMGPDERYDAITSMTDTIQLRLADKVLERIEWLDHPDFEVREEAQNFITGVQDQINEITKVRVALYNALGLGEKRGALPGGKEVPRLLLPARTAADFEKEYGEVVQQFGPPKGAA